MKIRILTLLAAALLTQQAFADADTMDESKPCATVVKACLDAGYTRDSTDKRFWKDCMKPILLGNSVSGVTIDASVGKACRKDKVEEMKKQIKEFQESRS